jgi:hypothetical protein
MWGNFVPKAFLGGRVFLLRVRYLLLVLWIIFVDHSVQEGLKKVKAALQGGLLIGACGIGL